MSERLKRFANISLVVLMVVVPAAVVGILAAYLGVYATMAIMAVGGFFVLWVIAVMNAKPEEEDEVESVTIETREPESCLSKGLKLYGAYHLGLWLFDDD